MKYAGHAEIAAALSSQEALAETLRQQILLQQDGVRDMKKKSPVVAALLSDRKKSRWYWNYLNNCPIDLNNRPVHLNNFTRRIGLVDYLDRIGQLFRSRRTIISVFKVYFSQFYEQTREYDTKDNPFAWIDLNPHMPDDQDELYGPAMMLDGDILTAFLSPMGASFAGGDDVLTAQIDL